MSKSISAKATVPTRWVVESLSQIARHQDPLSKLQVMLDAILNFRKGKTVLHHFCASFMLRELTSCHRCHNGTSRGTFQYLFRLEPDGIEAVEIAMRAV